MLYTSYTSRLGAAYMTQNSVLSHVRVIAKGVLCNIDRVNLSSIWTASRAGTGVQAAGNFNKSIISAWVLARIHLVGVASSRVRREWFERVANLWRLCHSYTEFVYLAVTAHCWEMSITQTIWSRCVCATSPDTRSSGPATTVAYKKWLAKRKGER